MRVGVIVGACVLALAMVGGAALAAPVQGGERRVSHPDAGPTYVAAPAGCPALPELDGRTPNLRTTVSGWYGPMDPASFDYTVDLMTVITGTITDTAGNTYRVSGRFSETGTRNALGSPSVLFRGTGRLTIVGAAGTFVGRATALVLGGPPERQLAFEELTVCRVR